MEFSLVTAYSLVFYPTVIDNLLFPLHSDSTLKLDPVLDKSSLIRVRGKQVKERKKEKHKEGRKEG